MNKKRLVALLCAFILVFTAVFTGCADKVTFNETTTKADDKIVIGEDYEDIPDDAEIVVGEDGQSYLVDGEGNSIVYEAPSAYVVPTQAPVATSSSPTTSSTTKKSYTLKLDKDAGVKSVTLNGKKETSATFKEGDKVTVSVELNSGYDWSKWTETSVAAKMKSTEKTYSFSMPNRNLTLKATTQKTTTRAQKDEVYDLVQNQRKSGGVDISGLTSYNTDVLRVPFAYGEDVFMVELHKGVYGTTTIGCEAGIYKKVNEYSWTKIDNVDEMKMSMTLWQYQSSDETGTPKQVLSTDSTGWWLGKFENGTIPNVPEPEKRFSNLVVKFSITFPTFGMMEAFADELAKIGFSECSGSDTKLYMYGEKFWVKDKTVTLVWKEHHEDKEL